MPKVRKQKIEADGLYRSWTVFAAHGVPGVIPRGAVLRGSHPAVQEHPHFFLPHPASDDEIAAREAQGLDDPAPTAAPPVKVMRYAAPPLADEDAVIAIRNAGETVGLRSAATSGQSLAVSAGSKVARDHPAVKSDKAAFVPVTRGVERERALVALAPITHEDAEGNSRTIYAGQWVDREDPLVELHPFQWRLPDPAVAPAEER